jgi:OOP family OmpA-OmpF porin
MNKHLVAGLLFAALSAGASAQSAYGVISVGSSRLSVDCSGTSNCDKTDSAYKLLAGYKYSPNFAAEAGLFGFGKARASDGTVSAQIKNEAFGAGVAFHQDLTPDWNFVARVGLASVRTRISGTVSGLGSVSDSDNNVAPYAGLGVGYKLSKTVSLDGAVDFSRSKYNKNGVDESGSLSAISIGLTFGF